MGQVVAFLQSSMAHTEGINIPEGTAFIQVSKTGTQ